MNDTGFMRGFEGFGDLFRDRERLIERDGPSRDAVGERWAFDEFEDQRLDPISFFEAVDLRDVRMVQ